MRVRRARQGPIVLVAPRVLTHHENLHGLLTRDAVIDPAQQVVVPAQHVDIGIALGGLAEIQLAGLAVERAVVPGAEHQPLAGHTAFQSHIVAHCTALENVVPAAHAVDRHADVGVVIFNRQWFPVVVEIGMARPLGEIRRKTCGALYIQKRIFGERQFPHPLECVGGFAHAPVERVLD